jgi:phytoene desaturase
MSSKSNPAEERTIIVIGGGLGGLSAAIRLAKKGFAVSLFERSSTLGGKCRVENFGGYSFDTGPSLLTLPAVYRDLFIKTGAPLESEITLSPVDPAFEYHFASGKRLTLPNASRAGVTEAIENTFGEERAKEWVALMNRAEAMWDVSREPFVESELRGFLPLLRRPGFLRSLKIISPFTSLRTMAKRHLRAPELITLIDRYATYTGSDPRKAPAVLLTIAYIEQIFGAWHIEGGIGELSSALERRARELGVKIHLNSEVRSITTSKNRATGIILESGEEFMATHIISNVDAEFTYEKLLAHSSKGIRERRKLKRATPSFSGFYLLLGLKGREANQRHHTVSFPENYDAEFDSLFKSFTPVSDPTLYICSPRDLSMSPSPQHESWFVLVNAPHHNRNSKESTNSKNRVGFDWRAPGVAQRYSEHLVDLLEARGLLDRSRIETLTYRSPADIEELFNAPGGSIYGKSSNGASAAFNRASNRSPIEGLYLVGGSAHPGGGVPLVGISGEIVANAISSAPTK